MSDPEVVFGRVRVTEQDIRRGLVEVVPMLRRRWLFVAGLAVIVVVTLVAGQRPELGFAAIAPLAGMAAFFGVLFLAPWIGARRIVKAQGLSEGDVDYRFDPEGLTIRAPGASSTVAYRRISSFRDTPAALLISCTPGVANIIPKRAFSQADLERVRGYLAANVKPQRMRLPMTLILWALLVLAFLVVWQLFGQRPH